MMARNKIIISFSIDADVAHKLENLADAQGISRSSLVEKLIRDNIDQEGAVLKAFSNPALQKVFLKLFAQPDVLKELASAYVEPLSPDQVEQFHRTVGDVVDHAADVAHGN